MSPRPRDKRGRFVPLDCPDPDCGGRLAFDGHDRWDGAAIWHCDGLVARGEEPLFACPRVHFDGEEASRG